ncbi:MAG: DUF2796 domain-containing protein [Candidatus Thiodiazotropha sp.]
MPNISQGTIYLCAALMVGSFHLHAHGPEHEQHEAHVHGEAQLLLAIEGDDLEIELHSPAMNIVGFEHRPANAAQKQAVESAIDTLKQPGLVFNIPTVAKCETVSVEVETPLAEDDGHDDEDHTNFTGHYRFRCAAISRLQGIEVKLLKHFPGIEVIDVQSISKRGQQQIDLTPEQNMLAL